MKPETLKYRLRWKRWYRGKAESRARKGLTAHGTKRIYKMRAKPGYVRLSSIINELARMLSGIYRYLPYGCQTNVNSLARKLATIKRNHPRMKVRVK